MVQEGAKTEARDLADTTVIKVDLDRGRVRYINRTRMFDWDNDPHTGWDPAAAQTMVMSATTQLGIPSSEIDVTGGTWSGGTWSGGTWSGGTWSGGTWSGGTWSTMFWR